MRKATPNRQLALADARVLEELVFVRLEGSTVRAGRGLAREQVARITTAERPIAGPADRIAVRKDRP